MHQLTKNASIEEIEKAGLAPYYTDHGVDVYPVSAAGVPFTAAYAAVTLRVLFLYFLSITASADAVILRISFYLLAIFENISFKFIFRLLSNSILSINLHNSCLFILVESKNSSDSFFI